MYTYFDKLLFLLSILNKKPTINNISLTNADNQPNPIE